MDKSLKQNVSDKIESLLKYDNLKQVQKIIVIIFALVIVLDILFVTSQNDAFPTFSQIVHDKATGEYYVITWIWGLITAQLFFPKQAHMDTLSSLNKVVIVLSITAALLILGSVYQTLFESLLSQLVLFLSGVVIGYFLLPNDEDYGADR